MKLSCSSKTPTRAKEQADTKASTRPKDFRNAMLSDCSWSGMDMSKSICAALRMKGAKPAQLKDLTNNNDSSVRRSQAESKDSGQFEPKRGRSTSECTLCRKNTEVSKEAEFGTGRARPDFTRL